MLNFSRRFLYTLSNKIHRRKRRNLGNFPEEKLSVDFSKTKNSPFDIKSESSFNAYLSSDSLVLGLKKPNCISWIEIPNREFQDHVIEAKIRLDDSGGYASAGLLFHIMDKSSHYMAIISSKGYFRLDVVKDDAPRALIGWTEVSNFDKNSIHLCIITYGTYSIFIVNGKWAGDTSDESIGEGRLGFAAASYEAKDAETDGYACKACLEYFSVDTRIKSIEGSYKKWTDESNINAENRLLLAETYAAMGEASKSLEQINRAWKRRDEVIRAVSSSYTPVRTRKELLLAARMSFNLNQYNEANEYLDGILEQDDVNSTAGAAERKEAINEKIRTLNELNRFKELKEFVLKYDSDMRKDANFYSLLARCYFELKEYKKSAAEWKNAFEVSEKSGIYAANEANALELANLKQEALEKFIQAGKIFLKQDNTGELVTLIPKLTELGEKNWEARALAGKCAYSLEDYYRCEIEFAAADRIRCAVKPRPKGDPACFYLWGLVLNMNGKNREAIRRLTSAVKLAPDYGLFRFKLAELKITGGVKEPKLAEEFKLALANMDDPEGKMANLAGTLLLNCGEAKSAKYFFNIANAAVKKD